MREIRDLLSVIASIEGAGSRAGGESLRPFRRSAWGEKAAAAIQAIREHYDPNAIWDNNDGTDFDGVYMTPSLCFGRTDASTDVYDFWVGEGYPNPGSKVLSAVHDALYDELLDQFGEEIAKEAAFDNAPSDPDEFARDAFQIIETKLTENPELQITVPDPTVLREMFKSALTGVDNWHYQIDWHDGYPSDGLEEEFLNEHDGNWLVSEDSDSIVNVGAGFVHRNVISFDDFQEKIQELEDEAEEGRIEEFDYEYPTRYEYRNPQTTDVEKALIEAAGGDENGVVDPAQVRQLVQSLPKYMQSQISRFLEAAVQQKTPVTAEQVISQIQDFDLTFNVSRADEEYMGETLSGSPFTFAFNNSNGLVNTVNNIGKVAGYLFEKATQSGHYGRGVIAYARIDGETIDIRSGDRRGSGWVIENVQSDTMRRLGDYMGKEGAERRKQLAADLQVSKSEVERQINRLSNYLSEWPFMIGAFLEEAAQSNRIDYLIWTDAKFQVGRWGGMSEGTAEYFYDRVPELLGYERFNIDAWGDTITGWIKEV